MNDLLLKGGTLVTPSDRFEADVLVRGGRIACIGRDLDAECEKLDLEGLLVMPGGIDTHVHLEHPIDRLGLVTADDFESGTVAAACGGVTSVVDFALQRKGETIEEAVRRRKAQAEGKAVLDYGLHVILTDVRDDVLEEIPRAVREGITSFKIYMTYSDKRVDDAGLLKVLERAGAHGALTYVHCENDAAVQHLVTGCLGHGDTEPHFHARSRPTLVEGEATHRAIALAELVEAPVFIAHVSSREALEAVSAARRRGSPVWAETCPQYLTLTDELYDPSRGWEAAKFVCTPPLRSDEHRAALWDGLRAGSLSSVSSDHAPFRFEDQKRGSLDFTRIPNGVPGIETRLPLLFSEGVSRGRLTPERFVQLVAANPARLFGLYPRKGSLAIGADADLVAMDPARELVVDARALHHRVDYSPYEGMRLRGAPVLTISRGEIVSADGEPSASAGRGRFVPRLPAARSSRSS